MLKQIDASAPDGPHLHIVMDDYAAYTTPGIGARLARRPHWHIRFTPSSASWIKQLERWFAELTRQQLERGGQRSRAQRQADIRAFIASDNDNPGRFTSTKSADEILASVKPFRQNTDQTSCRELWIEMTSASRGKACLELVERWEPVFRKGRCENKTL